MVLFIKNMVCDRCILAVKSISERMKLDVHSVQLGEIHFNKILNSFERSSLQESLNQLGFEILDDQKQKLIEQIKCVVIDHIHSSIQVPKLNFSQVLSKKLHRDYSFLSNLFSEVEGSTIEQYVIRQKIEKAKELLIYNELSLSEIAFQLSYSSVAHLSNQFKKVTGLSPSHFKTLGNNKRVALDKLRSTPK